ncbi:MAG: 1-deoxy-D-xylulose-5-phosphate synthase [Deltaproteobacteria bacterium]|nr:1-deoxy-D-xylulose-5-phosphate synthase [Deltaproteobacteria bacterium]
MMTTITMIPLEDFERVRKAELETNKRLDLLADMCRANALAAVKQAGSGHLGSSFSAMDIVVRLYYEEMNVPSVGLDHPDRDVYFSSKGHDVPGLYSVLFSLGLLSEEKFFKLRRFGGLDGHPDIACPGVEANSGSLGMGISKGRGIAWAKRYLRRGGRVFVMTGDGELQEGQNFEALQSAVQQGIGNLTVIVDHNKVQSDREVSRIVSLHDLKAKLAAFGWHVARCDGHDQEALARVFDQFRQIEDTPKILIADTVKGRGVSFMEHPRALQEGGGFYRWHAGAPPDGEFMEAHGEIVARINRRLAAHGLDFITLKEVPPPRKPEPFYTLEGEPESTIEKEPRFKVTDEYVSAVYGESLMDVAGRRDDVVVLDADLAADCKVRTFELTYPDRFIENGIAEQDMVSMAGGLARQGLLPVVNSFASFLASRANEQIYNNAGEQTKIIYACHYAGLIPAGPGKSHQSLRDISLFGALPNCEILQPCNGEETRMVVDYAVDVARENVMIRLIIGPSPREIRLPPGYKLKKGRGVTLADGDDAVLFAYGPVMIHEAMLASELLARKGTGLRVVNSPWLNRMDREWMMEQIRPFKHIFVVEDHAPVGGFGDFLLNELIGAGGLRSRSFAKFAVEGYPACGTPAEALRFHSLDGASLADRVLSGIRSGPAA